MTNNIANKLILHQSLHGYSRGHTLIASSVEILPKDARRMLRLSDMSGLSMTKGFETYLTGYPLVDRDVYVLARTWYASEISRPGCVWTHSLMVNSSDLLSINFFRDLLPLFVRPDGDWDRNDYSTPIIFIPNQDTVTEEYVFQDNLIFEDILFSLYEYPQKQIFISTEDKISKRENDFLKIWDVQWGNLKNNFSFCTGSIESRSSTELIFDLQLIPNRNQISTQRKNPEGIFLHDLNHSYEDRPNWTRYLAKHINNSVEVNILKKYLDIVGKDIPGKRVYYSKLLYVFYEITQSPKNSIILLRDLLEFVENNFPSNKEALYLKKFLFGEQIETLSINVSYISEVDLLNELCTTRNYQSLDPQHIKIPQRAQKLLRQDPDAALSLLNKILDSKPNPLGESFVRAFFEIVNTEKMYSLANYSDQTLHLILYNYPSLAIDAKIWSKYSSKREEILETLLSSPELGEVGLTQIVHAALEERLDGLIVKLLHKSTKSSTFAILDWIKYNSEKLNKENHNNIEWKYQLASKPDLIIWWLKETDWNINTAKAICSFISILNPQDFLKMDIDFWNDKISTQGLTQTEKIKLFAFMFSLGIRSKSEKAAILVSKTFLIVYNAARDSLLSYESWYQMSGILPEVSWYQVWDKCERLRRGYLELFFENEWDPIYFFKGSDQEDLFIRLIQYVDEFKRYKKFIQKSLDSMQHIRDLLSAAQYSILRTYRYVK